MLKNLSASSDFMLNREFFVREQAVVFVILKKKLSCCVFVNCVLLFEMFFLTVLTPSLLHLHQKNYIEKINKYLLIQNLSKLFWGFVDNRAELEKRRVFR